MKDLNLPIIMDFDDVLVYHTAEFYNILRRKWSKYSRYFNNLGALNLKEVYARPDFLLTEWLFRDEFRNISEDEKKRLTEILQREFTRDCFSKDVYSYLSPSIFAQRTLMNPLYMEHPNVKKIYLVTRNASPEMEEYKRAFVKKHFPSSKIELIFVGKDDKKSDALKKKNLQWGLFVEDEIKNIRDIAEHENLEGKEFLIPRYGYNKMPLDLSLLIHGKGGTFSYFDPFVEE